MNWIDTAGVYGLGHSEEVVARALEGVSRRPYVFTKCSMTWDANGKIGRSLRAGSVRRECEASLRRLRVEAIDLYQIHWPVPIRRRWTRAGRRSPPSSRRKGPLDRRVELRRRAARVRRPRAGDLAAAALLAAAPRDRAGRAARCLHDGIGVIAYSPMGAGLLTGKMTRARVEAFPARRLARAEPDFQEPRLTRNLALQDLLVRIGARHGTTAAAVSVAWTLLHPAVTGAIVGARSAEQVDGFVAAGDLALTNEDVGEIERFLLEHP